MTELATLTGESISIEPSLLERLRRFADSLGLGLFDRKLEIDGQRVVYYYDTNVVYNMMLGFEAERAGATEKPVKQRLVRSLLSCKRLGEMHMLRPHAMELDKKLNNLPKPGRNRGQESLRSMAQEYLESKKINRVLRRLDSIIADCSEGAEEGRIDRFLEVLREAGAETFTAIEQINGTWTVRLRRYYDEKLLYFDRLGPNIEELMDNNRNLVLDILKILERFRSAQMRFPNFHDSMALAILHLKLLERDQDDSADIVRFYSHDRALNEACRKDKRLRELLSHRSAHGLGQDVRTTFLSAIRDDDYFLMRLRFEELSPSYDGEIPLDLHELEALHLEIRQILGQHGETRVREETLQHIQWRGEPLLDVLDEFEKLSLMDSIWARHKLPPGFAENLSQWTDVFNFAQSGEFTDSLDEKIADIQHLLSSKVSLMRRWTEDFKILERGSRSMRRQIQKDLENPMRDLGLVRWGYSLSDDIQEHLVDSVMALLQPGESAVDQDTFLEVCSELASRIDKARSNIEECLFMSAVLWAIGKFNALVQLIEDCEKANVGTELLPSLVVLRAAARLKALDDRRPKAKSFTEKKRLVDEVVNLWETLPEAEGGGYLLGVGYVLYHAWKTESRAIEVGDAEAEVEREVKEWACKSLQAGKEARRAFAPSGLAWAFAVNHCAYVSLVTETAPEEEQEAFREALVKLEGEAVWNSRFDDTLGCFQLIPMEREWNATPVKDRPKLEFERRIRRAEEYFQAALETDFGDIDLKNHIRRLEHLKDRYESVRS